MSFLSISQTILWGLSPTVGPTRPGYAYCPCSRKRTSDKCSHFAASTGAKLDRAPALLVFPLFSAATLCSSSNVEDLTMANMALFQIIVNKCYPFVDPKRICQLSVLYPPNWNRPFHLMFVEFAQQKVFNLTLIQYNIKWVFRSFILGPSPHYYTCWQT